MSTSNTLTPAGGTVTLPDDTEATPDGWCARCGFVHRPDDASQFLCEFPQDWRPRRLADAANSLYIETLGALVKDSGAPEFTPGALRALSPELLDAVADLLHEQADRNRRTAARAARMDGAL